MTDQSNLSFGFLLHEVPLELSILSEQLEAIAESVALGDKKAREELDKKMSELAANHQASPEDELFAWWEYNNQTSFVIPLIYRNPFLVSMYAVYEAVVTDVSRLMRKEQKQAISIDDLKGGFLARSHKYYRHIINFELTNNDTAWEQLKNLSRLRNIVAHCNNRLELAGSKDRKLVERLSKQGVGVKDDAGYLIVTQEFLEETFAVVKSELENLAARYIQWDTANREARRSSGG